jgi:hypothetical protein
MDGEPLGPGHWALVVSPVRLSDGRLLMWHPPQPVAFNLIEAKGHRDRGLRQRVSIISKLKKHPPGGAHNEDQYRPANSHAAIDCLSELQSGVLLAFTAIESLANHAVEMLEDSASLTMKKKVIAKSDMTRMLGIDDKLKRVLPMVDGGVHIAGTAAWGRYSQLKFLRDELLHVKRRGYEPDPARRTAYDRLIVGEGDACVEDALAVIQGAWPGFLPKHVVDAVR